jgi:hypothetical protein
MSDRNTRVVIALVFAMTVGAGALFLMDGTFAWSGASPLTAVAAARPKTIESIEIEYIWPSAKVDHSRFDYVIYPIGSSEHLYVSPTVRNSVRVAVVGSGSARLDESQQANLLNVLGTLRRSRGFSLGKVTLAAGSDPRQVDALPGDAKHMWSILVGRGIVR